MRLVAIAAAWVAGLVAGLEPNAYLPAIGLLILGSAILGYLLWSKGLSIWPSLLVAVALLGIVRVEAWERDDTLQSLGRHRTLGVRGLVSSDPEFSGPVVEFTLSAESLDRGQGWEPASGRVLVRARPNRELVRGREAPFFRYGDRLQLQGELELPPRLEDFDYRDYLANQGIHVIMAFPQVELMDEGGGNPTQGLVFGLRRKLSRGLVKWTPSSGQR